MLRKALLPLATALLVIGCAQEPPLRDTSTLDTILRAAVDSDQVPAVVAMVATRQGVTYQGAVGLPMDAIFAIASMTKPLTAAAIMQLVEADKVQLDEPADTYLPDLRGVQVLEGGVLRAPKSRPTVRQMLTHTSGFAYEFLNRDILNYVQSGKLASMWTGTEEFLRAPLITDPGTRWEYGINFEWLGRLVEAVSGQSLDVYFREHIFVPLGMTQTFFNVPPEQWSRVPPQYARQPDGSLVAVPSQPPTPTKFFNGGGGLYSTAADYIKFARALLAGGELDGHRILKAETVAMMGQNQIGDMTIPPMTTQNPQLVSATTVLPGAPDVFGLGVALNRKAFPSTRGANTMSWAGVFNTFFWIDQANDVCAVVMVQMLPFGDSGATKLVEDFEQAVYQMHE